MKANGKEEIDELIERIEREYPGLLKKFYQVFSSNRIVTPREIRDSGLTLEELHALFAYGLIADLSAI